MATFIVVNAQEKRNTNENEQKKLKTSSKEICLPQFRDRQEWGQDIKKRPQIAFTNIFANFQKLETSNLLIVTV